MSPQPFFHLRSAKFPILPREPEELVNEGTYGKALAVYLQTHLQQRGYEAPFICCEDWGWWVEIKGQPFTLGCLVYGASDANAKQEFCVSVSQHTGRHWSWRRFRFVDTTDRVNQLTGDMRSILESDPEIEFLGVREDFPLE